MTRISLGNALFANLISKENRMLIIQFNKAQDWSFSAGLSWQHKMEAQHDSNAI